MNNRKAFEFIEQIKSMIVSDEEVEKILSFIKENKNSKGLYIADDEWNFKTIQLSLSTEKYHTLLYTQGERFLKGLLAYYQQEEKFEKCQLIIEAFNQHNSFDNDTPLTTEIE